MLHVLLLIMIMIKLAIIRYTTVQQTQCFTFDFIQHFPVFYQIFLLCFPQFFWNPHFLGNQKRRKYISRKSKSWIYFKKDWNEFYRISDCNCLLIVASWWLSLECQQRATNATSDENNTCWWPPETFSSTLEWSHHDHDFSPLKPINYPSHYNVWNSI